jgi:hypothetical protein
MEIPEEPISGQRKERGMVSRFFFSYLFFIGTLIAAIGWLAEWKHLEQAWPIFHHAAVIAAVGHAAQIVGALVSLITPDRTERDRH